MGHPEHTELGRLLGRFVSAVEEMAEAVTELEKACYSIMDQYGERLEALEESFEEHEEANRETFVMLDETHDLGRQFYD